MDQWAPVWVVVDGSTDHSEHRLSEMAAAEPNLRVWVLPKNGGKGAAVLFGLREAQALGFTHVLTLDSDGQHPTASIAEFMQASLASPNSMVLGEPVFDHSAPRLARQEAAKYRTGGPTSRRCGPASTTRCLAFASIPSSALISVMRRQPWMRRFDFDVEAVVRLCWRGVQPINLPAPVRYFRPEEGGVSHFHYGRDNALLTWMHFRLFLDFWCACRCCSRDARRAG